MTELAINAATPDDAGVVHELVLALARYEHLEHEVTATVDDIRNLLTGLHPYAEAIIARWQGEPVGFALFFHNVSTFRGKPGIFLEDLFVKPEHRRRGIGRALLRHLAQIAVNRGCPRMEWTALDWNRPALDFYDQLGAHVRKDWLILRMEDPALAMLSRNS
jgi:GNAT superfamily N-acetyltransferase